MADDAGENGDNDAEENSIYARDMLQGSPCEAEQNLFQFSGGAAEIKSVFIPVYFKCRNIALKQFMSVPFLREVQDYPNLLEDLEDPEKHTQKQFR